MRNLLGTQLDPHSYHFQTIDTPDLTAPAAAVARAQSVGDHVRERHPGDPERIAAVEEAICFLRASWTDNHRAYMRRGQQVGRRATDDPVRVIRRQMRAEEKRLRAMLNRTSGTAREPPPSISAASMRGHIARAIQVNREIATEFEQERKFLGSGSWTSRRGGGGTFRSMRELNTLATGLLDQVRDERARVNLAWQRYERTPPRTYAEQDAHDGLWQRLALLREEADDLTAELVAASRQRKPDPPRKNGPWTFEKIDSRIRAYESEHGRRPTKAEFNSDPTLPFYTEVRRKLGPKPLQTLDVLSSP